MGCSPSKHPFLTNHPQYNLTIHPRSQNATQHHPVLLPHRRPALLAQTTEPTPHTTADLQQREAKLIETAKASPTGFAVATLDDYGNDYTLLVVRIP